MGGNLNVSGQDEVTSKLTFEGSVPLVFGFKAVRLYYDEGRYTAFKPVEAGDAAMRRARRQHPEDGTTRLITGAPFLRLSGE